MKTDSEILSYLEASHGVLTLYYAADTDTWTVGVKNSPPERRVTERTLREAVSAYMDMPKETPRRSLL